MVAACLSIQAVLGDYTLTCERLHVSLNTHAWSDGGRSSANVRRGTGQGFNDLAGYIFGGNAGGQRMEMTTPVITTAGQPGAAMRFPMERKLGDDATLLPTPNDSRCAHSAARGCVVQPRHASTGGHLTLSCAAAWCANSVPRLRCCRLASDPPWADCNNNKSEDSSCHCPLRRFASGAGRHAIEQHSRDQCVFCASMLSSA